MSLKSLRLLPLAAPLAACPLPTTAPADDDDATSCAIVVPAAWSATDWDTHAAEALALRAQLDVLVADTMRAAEQGTVVVDAVTDLTAPYEAADPSLRDITSAGYATVVDAAFAEFIDVLAAGSVDLVDAGANWTPGAAGGVFGTEFRGINEGGLELRQLVDKGLFGGAAFYAYAAHLTADHVDAATVDAISAVWGNNGSLDPAQGIVDGAEYTHAMGYHAEAADFLVAARAYAGDAACSTERDAAVLAFFRTWEKAMFGRFVHYANVAARAAAAAVDAEGFASALHELSEGIGLALGFRGLDAPASGPLAGRVRVVTDVQIDAMMAIVGVDIGNLGASTTGEAVVETDFGQAASELEAQVGSALDVDAAEVAGWRAPIEG